MRTLTNMFPVILVALMLVSGQLHAQDVGGPYTPDENTVLLLNFDNPANPWENLSDHSGDANPHGNPVIADYSARDGLGSSLFLDGDESWLQVLATSALDLEDDWTIEMWFRVEADGMNHDLIWKPGPTPQEWWVNANYWVEVRGDRVLETGSYGAPTVHDNAHRIQVGEWYHVTYIRDSQENVHLQVVRNADLEVLWILEADIDPEFNPPPSFEDLYIGYTSHDRWMHGYIDELRMSNIIREELIDIDTEPVFVSLSHVENQQVAPGEAVTVESEISATMDGIIASATLHYQVNDDWQEVSMNNTSGNLWQAEIPGHDAPSVVKYYVSAISEDDVRGVFPVNAESDDYVEYYMYAVEAEASTLVDVRYSGGLVSDHSSYGSLVTLHGDPQVVAGRSGSQGLHLDGDGDLMRVFAPSAGASDEFLVDVWFRAGDWSESFWNYLVRKPGYIGGGPAWWGESTFEILTGAFDDPEPKITIGTWSGWDFGNTRITFEDHIITEGDWYRVIMGVRSVESLEGDYELFGELRGGSNQIIEAGSAIFEAAPWTTYHPIRFGQGGGDRPFVDVTFGQIRVFNHIVEVPTSVDDIPSSAESPDQFALKANYPNPFNPVTMIPYTLAETGQVTLTVYDALGRQVATLVNERQSVGTYQASFDAANLSSGIYFYQLKVDDYFSDTRQMLLVK